jgi:hypothetical protein
MPRVTNRSCIAPLILLLTFPIWTGCGHQSEQQSPLVASKGEGESSTGNAKQPTTRVSNNDANRDRVAKPRIELRTIKSEPEKATSPRESNVATKRAPKSESRPNSRTTGTLDGRVLLTGKIPPARRITVTKNEDVCGLASGEVHNVVVSKDRGLKDVVVEILGIEPGQEGFEWNRPKSGYVLRQKGCQFGPPLLVMPTGEKLTVVNDDPIGHNVNSGQWNEQQPGGGAPIVRQLTGNRPVRVGCNVHSWMEAWVYLARSPFYAVTDAEGKFRIENVPPGTYRVTYWHSSLRPAREKVTIAAGDEVQQEVALKSPVRS